MNQSLSVKDIQHELGCSPNHARAIVLNELPHHNIALKGERPTWRVRRKDFDSWMAGREHEPGIDRIRRFSAKYMR